VPTVSFIGISSYLLFTGIYYSAISISLDHRIRSSIHKSVEKELDFVSNIGASQMEEEIQRRVARATKKMAESLEQQSGVELPMEKEDIDKHIRLAVEEAHKLSKERERK
jgi:LPS O-antigen subunit length determinant protein (WzzB/FepE family)